MLTFASNIQPVKSLPTTIIVPDDYSTIQWAISIADSGDTVFVRNGTYYENLIIDKRISLIGENKSTTIIDGRARINADGVLISGFTIQNGTHSNIMINSDNNEITGNIITNNTWMAGIYIQYGARNTIRDNLFKYNDKGIYLYWDTSVNNIVANNTFVENSYGIIIARSSNNLIENNTMTNNGIGISMSESKNNTIRNNILSDNLYGGIQISVSTGNVLRHNVMSGCGLDVYGFSIPEFTHDIDTSNTVNGKPIYYRVNRQNETVPTNAGYVGIVNSTGILVQGLNVSNNGQGVLFAFTSDSTIENVNASNNVIGIQLFGSDSNLVRKNIITNNSDGIKINNRSSRSNENIVENNTIINSRSNGINLRFSSSNIISNNTIANGNVGINLWGDYVYGVCSLNIFERNTVSNNEIGIQLMGSSYDNTIYHNNFINNTNQLGLISANVWDLGYPSGGNYWSDHTCTGNPNDGSEPYFINEYILDNYPFQDPNGWLLYLIADINGDKKVDIKDIGTAARAFGTYPGHERWNPDADVNNDDAINLMDIAIIARHFGETI